MSNVLPDLSLTEENYLKAIFHLSEDGKKEVNTNSISYALETAPATVSDMLKKLAKKEVVYYEKYHGVRIAPKGRTLAIRLIRKHRLWEVFLVSKLKFNWDEVHVVAEQLEHIRSPLLIERLDEFLGFPNYDPHGDPIPDKEGEFKLRMKKPLNQLNVGESGVVMGVNDDSSVFLKYLDKLKITINTAISVVDKVEFDGSVEILVDDLKTTVISREVAENIFVSY